MKAEMTEMAKEWRAKEHNVRLHAGVKQLKLNLQGGLTGNGIASCFQSWRANRADEVSAQAKVALEQAKEEHKSVLLSLKIEQERETERVFKIKMEEERENLAAAHRMSMENITISQEEVHVRDAFE